jgi:hypothetical protein
MNTKKQLFRNLFTVICLSVILIVNVNAQTFLKTVWEKEYETDPSDRIFSSVRADDGSVFLIGETGSSASPSTKIIVLKINPSGDQLWRKEFGSNGDFRFRSVCKSQNEGFYILGTKQDGSSKKLIWIAKSDSNGTLLWESTTGGGEKENITDIAECPDNGLFICGSKEIKGDHDTDAWLIKLTKKGAVESQALFGTRYIDDEFSSIISDNAGGFILSGFTSVKMGESKVPFFIGVDYRGNKKWEKSFPDLARTIPSSSFINKSGSVICFANVFSASGEFEKISKIVLSASGELVNTFYLKMPVSISKNSYMQTDDDQIVMLSSKQAKSEPASSEFLIRLDNTLKPVWVKNLALETVSLECLVRLDNTGFISAGSVNTGTKMNCEALLFQDLYDSELEKYINRKLLEAGMTQGESRTDFRTRIGRSKYDGFIAQYTSDATKDLLLLPESFTRDINAPSDSRPSILISAKKDTDPKDAVAMKGNYFALLIAINDYKDPNINSLDKPISDAQKLFDVLVSDYLFEKANITFLKNPTREQIISSLDRLEKTITKNDNLLIFYAGHGYWNDVTQKGFWLASDASKENTANWIGNSSISDYIRSIPAKHTLLIADACFSGSIFKTRAAFGGLDKSAQRLYELTSRKAMTSGTLTEVPDKSVFIEFLVKRLADNSEAYLSSEQLFFSFKPAVLNNTENIPQFGVVGNAGDEGGDFLFIRRKK